MVPSNNDQLLHQTFNFQNLYPNIDKQKIKWDKVVSGETDRHRKYVCVALSISTAIVAAGAIGAIVACVLSASNVLDFIPIPLLVGGGAAVSLGVAAYLSKGPTDKGKNILSGNKKKEWTQLFTKGTLDNLKEYVYLNKLNSLIYQGVISSERGGEILELLSGPSRGEYTNFYLRAYKTETDPEGKWKVLRNKIYEEIPSDFKNNDNI